MAQYVILTATGSYYAGTREVCGSVESSQNPMVRSLFVPTIEEAKVYANSEVARLVSESINDEYADWGLQIGAIVGTIL